MKFSELIEHCITCIKGFNPVIKTIDSHADEFISQVRNKSLFSPNLNLCPYSSRTLTKRYSSSKCSTGARVTKISSG